MRTTIRISRLLRLDLCESNTQTLRRRASFESGIDEMDGRSSVWLVIGEMSRFFRAFGLQHLNTTRTTTQALQEPPEDVRRCLQCAFGVGAQELRVGRGLLRLAGRTGVRGADAVDGSGIGTDVLRS